MTQRRPPKEDWTSPSRVGGAYFFAASTRPVDSGDNSLPLNVAEFQFRYNNRINTDILGATNFRALLAVRKLGATYECTEGVHRHHELQLR
jgi:hypothetical protein